MESELMAQRDAAIAVAKELQRQQQTHQKEMERLFERRTLNAERLRLHAEEKYRRAVEDRKWSESCCHRLLTWTLFVGCGGAVVGWAVGLLLLLALKEPLVGFLLVLPGMALGTLVGLTVAKTQVELQSRRRDARNRDARRHVEVEMAVRTGVGEQDAPLEPLEDVSDMQDMVDDESRVALLEARQEAAREDEEKVRASEYGSMLSWSWNAAWYTLQTSKSIAVGLYYGGSRARSLLLPSAASRDKDA
ncbi:unnamed protein product [Hyaloperonospora brassicae]|uniref:RxLR effector candidate protein n=1 Tax=Hyaloperonospora brassicae TaxID=162125 RepID=A0AAV0TP32_HYABA|nr:unnamed protein product [Hyaloperonospora brassicae]